MKTAAPIFAVLIFLFSCVTVDTKTTENLSAEEFFFHAQVQQGQIKTKKDYEAVIALFEEVIARFPDYKAIGVECRYEIAYLLYRQEKYREAEDAFFEILRTYETESSEVLPEWPQIFGAGQNLADRTNAEPYCRLASSLPQYKCQFHHTFHMDKENRVQYSKSHLDRFPVLFFQC